MQSSEVRWAPSMHRDLHGEKNDHGLVASKWKWRIRSPKAKTSKDFSVLTRKTYDEAGNQIKNKYLAAFSQTVREKVIELQQQHEQESETKQAAELSDTTVMHKIICAAIGHAVDVVIPEAKRTRGVKRKVSEATKRLYERRTNMQGCTQEQYDDINRRIKEAGLQDFRKWVEEHSAKMKTANGCGDTRTIYKSVRTLAGKRQKPSTNLTTDGKGNLLGSAHDVAKRWTEFLRNKFAATQAEACRQGMHTLGSTVGQGQLTREEILEGLGKMSNDKATGPDELSIEIFKVCPVCKQLLIELLQAIWRDETVPIDFAKAKFIMV